MEIPTGTWTAVGGATPTYITLQNVGDTILLVVLAATIPADGDNLDPGEHFRLYPSQPVPASFGELATEGKSCFVRSWGPKSGFVAFSVP